MNAEKIDHDMLIRQIQSEKEGYLLNDFEDAVVRFTKEGDKIRWFLKFKEGDEFEASRSHRIVNEAILDSVVIGKSAYHSY